MLLSIVTLNYRKPELTIACIESLHKQFSKEFDEAIIELIVIDNSCDNSYEKIKNYIKKESYKNTQLVVNDQNLGFGKGCNMGAKTAKGELLLFLNNDTDVKDEGILNMANYIKDNQEVAILGGQLMNSDGTPQPSSGKFYTLFYAFLLLLGLQKFGLLDKSPKKISEVDWVKGGLFMIRKDVFRKLSGFDENIFMYTEDMELCYRAKKQNFKTFFYHNIKIIHKEHGSASKSFAIVQIYKGLLYFYKKHRSKIEFLILKEVLWLKATMLILIGEVTRNSYLTNTYKEAKAVL